jgi:hypothetical protein
LPSDSGAALMTAPILERGERSIRHSESTTGSSSKVRAAGSPVRSFDQPAGYQAFLRNMTVSSADHNHPASHVVKQGPENMHHYDLAYNRRALA